MSLKINVSGLDSTFRGLDRAVAKIKNAVADEMNAFGQQTVNDAKRNCPVDEGHLRNSITYTMDEANMIVEIVVNADYAAFVEFGTRGFASQYVATLPDDWQEFASQFKGGGGGSFEDMVARIFQWVKRKRIKVEEKSTQTEQGDSFTKTGRLAKDKKRKRVNKEKMQEQLAWAIAIKIMREGSKPHPFLKPAVEKNKKVFVDNVKKVI